MSGDLQAVNDPLIGSILGKDYMVVEQIGQGGMGVVYLVEHQSLRKRFAITQPSGRIGAARFERGRRSRAGTSGHRCHRQGCDLVDATRLHAQDVARQVGCLRRAAGKPVGVRRR